MLPGLPDSEAYVATSAGGMLSVQPVPPDPGSASKVALAVGAAACRTSVGTAVAMSSSTGQIGSPTRALTRELLPCLNSPTTGMRTELSLSSFRAVRSRATRSSRS